MTTPEQPAPDAVQQGEPAGSFEAGTLHVNRLPDENLATLSRFQYQVLRDGEVNEARAGRDLCLGFLGSAAVGFVGLIATIDWDTAFHQAHKAPFLWSTLLFAIALASAVGALIYDSRYKRTRNNSAYSALIKKLDDHFPSPDTGAYPQHSYPRWALLLAFLLGILTAAIFSLFR